MADDYALDDFDDYKEEDFDEESSPQSPPSIIVQPPKPVMGAQKTITTAPVLTSTALPSIGGQTGRASSAHLKPGAARPQSRTSHTSQTPSKIGASLAVENRQLKDLVQKLRQQLMNAVHGDRQIELQNKLVESQRELKLLKEENRALKRVQTEQVQALANLESADVPKIVRGFQEEQRALKESVLKAQARAGQAEMSMRNMNDRLNKAHDEIKRLEAIVQLKGTSEDLLTKMETAIKEKEAQTKQIDELMRQVGVLKHAKETTETKLQREITQLRRELQQAQKTTQEMTSTIVEKDKELFLKGLMSKPTPVSKPVTTVLSPPKEQAPASTNSSLRFPSSYAKPTASAPAISPVASPVPPMAVVASPTTKVDMLDGSLDDRYDDEFDDDAAGTASTVSHATSTAAAGTTAAGARSSTFVTADSDAARMLEKQGSRASMNSRPTAAAGSTVVVGSGTAALAGGGRGSELVLDARLSDDEGVDNLDLDLGAGTTAATGFKPGFAFGGGRKKKPWSQVP